MVTIWSLKNNTLEENNQLMVELRGLSTDTKPTSLTTGDIANGSVFIEIDTQDVYIYDGENENWDPIVESNDNEEDNNRSKVEEIKQEIFEDGEKEISENIDSQER